MSMEQVERKCFPPVNESIDQNVNQGHQFAQNLGAPSEKNLRHSPKQARNLDSEMPAGNPCSQSTFQYHVRVENGNSDDAKSVDRSHTMEHGQLTSTTAANSALSNVAPPQTLLCQMQNYRRKEEGLRCGVIY
ncbi:hypothetical protein T265_02915 [Opisthorchis viverrini]|uniref:Uncharacterized protein n=1 Tax=Opisthorchis viverrini TaxID=6198 RepID=A0A075AHY0_OPIVI|nr:hypothetical protein T265_02915 [Opisthorchis viverrini]KER30669.1 hypothetical protein T265_02915 [Opisthorchis viverrini]